MRGVPRARWMAGAAVLALSLAACGGGGGGGESSGKTGGTFRLGIVEPTAIDPYNAQESEGILVAHQLFTGLVDVKADGTIVPKLAEQRSPNDNCTEWTFKIKQGTKFTNGEPVDAEAFIRGWTRAAKKSAASDVAYHLAGIQGFDQLQAGTTQTFAGLSAPDPYTLKVKLSQPDCEFDLKTYHTVFSPVPKVAGEANNKQYNDQPIGNGPFKMEGPWQHNTKITLVRNDDYGFEKAKLDRVEISILNPQNADQLEYQGFESGKFDWARMPTPQLPAAKAKYEPQGQWIGQDTNGMNYLLPITDNGPMKTKEARLAVSYAIDRQAITQGVFKGMQTPSTTIVPPAFKDFYQQGLCQSCQKQDPAKAKEYAQKANLPPGSAVTLAFNTGGGHDEWVQAVAQQLRDVLGWKVEIKPMPFKELLEPSSSPAPPVCSGSPGARTTRRRTTTCSRCSTPSRSTRTRAARSPVTTGPAGATRSSTSWSTRRARRRTRTSARSCTSRRRRSPSRRWRSSRCGTAPSTVSPTPRSSPTWSWTSTRTRPWPRSR